MTPMVDEAGNVWEVDAAGNPVRMIAPAATAQPKGRVFDLGVSPKDAREESRAERSLAVTEANSQRSADNEAARLELARQEAARAAAKDAREAAKGDGPDSAANAKAKVRAAQAIQRQLGQMRQIYDRSFRGSGPIQSVREMLPSADAERMKALARTMRADLKPLIRGPSEGTFTEGDQALLDQLIPDPQAFDAYNEQLFTELETRVNDTLKQFGGDVAAATPQQRADNEVPGQPTGANDKPPPPGMIDSSRGTLAPITGDTRRVPNDKANAKINALINAGAWTLANQELQKAGSAPITPAERKRIEEWKRKYPNQPYNGTNVADLKPVSTAQQVLNSPLLSPVTTGLANYANSATAGTAGALAGDEGQGQLAAASALNPNAAVLGNVAGGVTGALAAESAIGGRLAAMGVQNAAAWAPRIGDTLYGAATGFNNAQDGQGLQGAATGAAVGLGGGIVGRYAFRGTGAALRGVNNPNVGYLQSRGIPLTVGQVVGDSGAIGAGIKKMEDAATGTPFVGSMVDARRTEGLGRFNDALFNQAAPPGANITATGSQGLQQIRSAVQDTYQRNLDPATIDVVGDPQLLNDMSTAQVNAMSIPDVGEKAADALSYRFDMGLDNAGAMTGRDFQEAYRGLGRDGRAAATGNYANEFAGATRAGQDALGEALERQNPGAFQGFLEANAANRRMNVLADALKNAGNQSDELITPAQINRADMASTSRLEGKINSAAGNRPFYDLATAGQAVLPSKLPDSGTWTRALVGGGLPVGIGAGAGVLSGGGTEGAATGGASGLGLMLMLAAGGSKPVQKQLVNALTKRPDAFRVAGDRLLQNAGVGGRIGTGFGSSVLTPLLVGP